MDSYRAIIDAWKSAEDFAADHGITPGLAHVWRHRDSIPKEYWDVTAGAAKKRRIAGITLPLLVALSRAKKARASA